MTINTQQIASVIRQVAALAALVIGALQSSGVLSGNTAGAAVLTAAGAIVLAVEHYVSDPSTGTTTPAPKAPPGA